MRWIIAVAVLSLVIGSTGAAHGKPRCPAGAVRAKTVAGGIRCVGLPAQVRIRIAIEGGAQAASVARRFRLTVRSVRAIARSASSRLLEDGRAATGLESDPRCSLSDGRAEAPLKWAPSGSGVQQVAVASSLADMLAGRFRVSRVLDATRDELTWRKFNGQAEHTWAVLTRTSRGWLVGETATFRGPLCAIDYQR